MDPIYIFIGVGALGGLARASYGLLKAMTMGLEINIKAFITTLVMAGVIGGLLGFVVDIDLHIAALAGYVGTDFLENLVKGRMKGDINMKKWLK